MKWISVKDRFPEDGGYFLCCYKDSLPFVASLFYYVNLENAFRNFDREKLKVTHWMPLPDAPEASE